MEPLTLILHTEATCKFFSSHSYHTECFPSHWLSLQAQDVLHLTMNSRMIVHHNLLHNSCFVLVRPGADFFHSELDVLSERYSQKCLELSRTEQSGQGRETELSHKQRELEQLRRENQVYLHAGRHKPCRLIDSSNAF